MAWNYIQDWLRSFSPLLLLLAAYGLVRACVLDIRRAAIAFSFQIALLFYMSAQSTFFERNLLICHLSLPILAALGAQQLWLVVQRRLQKRFSQLGQRRSALAAAALIAVPLLATTPLEQLRRAYGGKSDSRISAAHWIKQHVPPGSRLLVATELNMDMRPIASSYTIETFSAAGSKLSSLKRKHKAGFVLVPEFEAKYRKQAIKLGSAKVLARFGRRGITLDKFAAHDSRQLYTPDGNPKLAIVSL